MTEPDDRRSDPTQEESLSWTAFLRELAFGAKERSVPAYVGPLHYLGALALAFLLLQLFTGLLLMVYYDPSADRAYESVAVIMSEVRLGWLVRAVHRWAGHAVILLTFLHLLRVFFSRAYQSPRQLNWLLGIALMLLVVALGFTGLLLPWDQYAYWYVQESHDAVARIPLVGGFLVGLFWGGWEVGEEVLRRFYMLHVGLLPWAVAALVLLHLLIVWRFGIKPPKARGPASRAVPFYPDHVINLLIAVLLAGGVVATLAVVFPPALTGEANPVSHFAAVQPPWYLAPLRAVIRGLPGGLAALVVGIAAIVTLALPFVDSRPAAARRSFLQPTLGAVVLVALLILGVVGMRM